jgi:uncharacterized protein (DUF433 family)
MASKDPPREASKDRVVIDPTIAQGAPVIRGTQTPVADVVESLAGGMSFEDVQRQYNLSAEDVRAALRFVIAPAGQE